MTIVLFWVFLKAFLPPPRPKFPESHQTRPSPPHHQSLAPAKKKKRKKKAFLVTHIRILVSVLGPGAAGNICLPKDRMYYIVCQLLGP